MASFRGSHQGCSIMKGVLRNFAKFTGKHLFHSLFFNKVAGLRPPDDLLLFFWIWLFFSWAVSFHGLFWNRGWNHLKFHFLQSHYYRLSKHCLQVPTLTFLWWNMFYLQNLIWSFWVCLIRNLLARSFFERDDVIDQKEIINFIF